MSFEGQQVLCSCLVLLNFRNFLGFVGFFNRMIKNIVFILRKKSCRIQLQTRWYFVEEAGESGAKSDKSDL